MSRILGRIGELGEELECDFDIKEVLYCTAALFSSAGYRHGQGLMNNIYLFVCKKEVFSWFHPLSVPSLSFLFTIAFSFSWHLPPR